MGALFTLPRLRFYQAVFIAPPGWRAATEMDDNNEERTARASER
jgi:hypothetical protein